jgi:hypothetical protein
MVEVSGPVWEVRLGFDVVQPHPNAADSPNPKLGLRRGVNRKSMTDENRN